MKLVSLFFFSKLLCRYNENIVVKIFCFIWSLSISSNVSYILTLKCVTYLQIRKPRLLSLFYTQSHREVKCIIKGHIEGHISGLLNLWTEFWMEDICYFIGFCFFPQDDHPFREWFLSLVYYPSNHTMAIAS